MNEGNNTWVNAGTSQNKVYVTLGGNSDLETVIDVASRGTGGLNGTSKPAVFTGIWNQFAGAPGTARADGAAMKYWGPIAKGQAMLDQGFTKQDLILNADGKCGSWQGLLMSALSIQNVNSRAITIDPINRPHQSTVSISKHFNS